MSKNTVFKIVCLYLYYVFDEKDYSIYLVKHAYYGKFCFTFSPSVVLAV